MTNPRQPGWYDDPDGAPNAERRWDGEDWTPEFRRKAAQPTPQPVGYPQQAPPQMAYAPQAPPQVGYAQVGYAQMGFAEQVPPQPAYVPPLPIGKTNSLATPAMVTGLVGLIVPMVGLVGIVLGFMSLNQIGKSHEDGKTYALIGLIAGTVSILIWLMVVLVIAASQPDDTLYYWYEYRTF